MDSVYRKKELWSDEILIFLSIQHVNVYSMCRASPSSKTSTQNIELQWDGLDQRISKCWSGSVKVQTKIQWRMLSCKCSKRLKTYSKRHSDIVISYFPASINKHDVKFICRLPANHLTQQFQYNYRGRSTQHVEFQQPDSLIFRKWKKTGQGLSRIMIYSLQLHTGKNLHFNPAT